MRGGGGGGGGGRPLMHACIQLMQSGERRKYRLPSLSVATRGSRGNKLFRPTEARGLATEYRVT